MTLREMLEKRNRLVAEARAVLDAADAEERSLSAEEEQTYERIDGEIDSVNEEIRRVQTAQERRARLSAIEAERIKEQEESPGDRRGFIPSTPERRDVAPWATPEYRSALDRYIRGRGAPERRALEVGTASEGGYLVWDEFSNRMVETMDEFSVVRALAGETIVTMGDHKIPVESGTGTAFWVDEEGAYTASDSAWTQVVLDAYKAARLIQVSEELVNDERYDLEGYLARNFGRTIGTLFETAAMQGDGAAKPTGLTSQAGVNTNAAGAAAITADELIDVQHAIKSPYRAGATWTMADSTLKLIRKLKDGDSQYLWQPGLRDGPDGTLLGSPVRTSLGMPAATSGNVSVLYGDFRYVTIAQRGPLAIQRLNELYAANGRVGYRGYIRVDVKLTLAEAIGSLTQA